MSTTVAPDKILRELSDLWVSLGKQGAAEGGTGVLRACSMTLLVMAEESEDVQDLGETLAALMPEHPARAIIVRLRGAGERAISERVYSQCWMPFGQRRQICCEQIEITASDAALPDVPAVVLPLAVADLPVVLWCRSSRLFGMNEFQLISGMAQKVVVDSAGFPEKTAVLRQMSKSVGRGLMLGDLSWTRLTRWREMLAQVFENRDHLAQLERVRSVRVEFSNDHEVTAWYMGAWVSNALEEAGIKTELRVARAPGPTLRVDLEGDGLKVELVRQQDRLEVRMDGVSHCTNLSQPTDYLLMREELGILRHDAVFEHTLVTASRLAAPEAQ